MSRISSNQPLKFLANPPPAATRGKVLSCCGRMVRVVHLVFSFLTCDLTTTRRCLRELKTGRALESPKKDSNQPLKFLANPPPSATKGKVLTCCQRMGRVAKVVFSFTTCDLVTRKKCLQELKTGRAFVKPKKVRTPKKVTPKKSTPKRTPLTYKRVLTPSTTPIRFLTPHVEKPSMSPIRTINPGSGVSTPENDAESSVYSTPITSPLASPKGSENSSSKNRRPSFSETKRNPIPNFNQEEFFRKFEEKPKKIWIEFNLNPHLYPVDLEEFYHLVCKKTAECWIDLETVGYAIDYFENQSLERDKICFSNGEKKLQVARDNFPLWFYLESGNDATPEAKQASKIVVSFTEGKAIHENLTDGTYSMLWEIFQKLPARIKTHILENGIFTDKWIEDFNRVGNPTDDHNIAFELLKSFLFEGVWDQENYSRYYCEIYELCYRLPTPFKGLLFHKLSIRANPLYSIHPTRLIIKKSEFRESIPVAYDPLWSNEDLKNVERLQLDGVTLTKELLKKILDHCQSLKKIQLSLHWFFDKEAEGMLEVLQSYGTITFEVQCLALTDKEFIKEYQISKRVNFMIGDNPANIDRDRRDLIQKLKNPIIFKFDEGVIYAEFLNLCKLIKGKKTVDARRVLELEFITEYTKANKEKIERENEEKKKELAEYNVELT